VKEVSVDELIGYEVEKSAEEKLGIELAGDATRNGNPVNDLFQGYKVIANSVQH